MQNHLSGGQASGEAMVGKGATKGKKARSVTPQGERVPSGHCRDWVKKGTCARGDSCPYIHDDSLKGKADRSRATSKDKGRGRGQGKSSGKGKKSRSTSPAGDKKPPCRNHLKGKCTKGEQCAYWHSPPCRFFKSGTCNAGEKCIFLHAHVAAVGQGGPGQKQEPLEEPGSGSDAPSDQWKPPRPRRGSPRGKSKAKTGLQ